MYACMQVMTTNHPEILDPALIRPGRIDQKLLLAYMNWRNVVHMVGDIHASM